MTTRLQVEQFYHSRKGDWEALSGLLERAHGRGERLSPQDLARLGTLYRAATSDLALAQRDFPGQSITAYLNQLVARAHAVVYRGEPLSVARLLRFATSGFARLYRQNFRYVLAAALLFIIPAAAAGLGTAWRPETSRWLLPESVQELIPLLEKRELWTVIPVLERPYASSFIMSNNIRVAFMAFASGVPAGALTVWIMISNGLLIGGLTGLTSHYGLSFELWTFVIGHGVLELSVIFIAGGSGLMLGWAVLRPGLLRRRDALMLAARQAVYLLLGCVPLLVAAGLIEGFLSPAETLPGQVKWATGLGSGLLLYAYLLLAGRERGRHRRGDQRRARALNSM
jgi:uncharacterized membrane protein SpoIIM required for sporulation